MSLKQYITEAEAKQHIPQAGDVFAIELEDGTLLETYIMSINDNTILLDATPKMISVLREWADLEGEAGEVLFEGQFKQSMQDAAEGLDLENFVERFGHLFSAGEAREFWMAVNDVEDDAKLDEIDYQTEIGIVDRGEYDQEGDMAKDDLATIIRAARKLTGMLDDNENMPEWVQSKINKAADYVDTAADYIESNKQQGVVEGIGQPREAGKAIQNLKNLAVMKSALTMQQLSQAGREAIVSDAINAAKTLEQTYLQNKQQGNAIFIRALRDEIDNFMRGAPINASFPEIDNASELGDLLQGKLGKVNFQQGVAEGSKESYIIVRTDAEGKKDVFAGNFDTYERAQKELDGLLDHPLHTKYKQKFEIKRKGGEQGVAEGSLEELANTSLKVKEPKNFVNTNDRKQVVYKVMKFKSGKDTYLINFTVKSAPAFGKKQNWNALNVAFGVREEQDDYSFGDEIDTDLTAKNKNQFLIYSTVINAVRKFITEYNTEIDEIIMQGAGERQEAMYQRFFQSAGKYFPGWHHDGKHSLVRDVPRQTGKKVKEQGVAEGNMDEAKYQGREVALGKPMRGDVAKFKVYVRDPSTGNIKKVNFGHGGTSARRAGQKTMKIKKSDPARRRSFRARHNCDNPGSRLKARYWSCRAW